MKRKVIVSSSAKKDIARLRAYIKQELKMRQTANNYIKGLNAAINKLPVYGGSVGRNEYVQKMFGANARRITYKKMAIIFFVEDDTVYIKRIIASSLIH